jgi:hypothetical protein
MCISNTNNNGILNNNNNGILQDLILLLKIPVGMQKNFFEFYRQFGYMPSKRFTGLSLDQCMQG